MGERKEGRKKKQLERKKLFYVKDTREYIPRFIAKVWETVAPPNFICLCVCLCDPLLRFISRLLKFTFDETSWKRCNFGPIDCIKI